MIRTDPIVGLVLGVLVASGSGCGSGTDGHSDLVQDQGDMPGEGPETDVDVGSDCATAGVCADALVVIAPTAVRSGEGFPVVVWATAGGQPAVHVSTSLTLTVDETDIPPVEIRLVRGAGSASVHLPGSGEVWLRVEGLSLAATRALWIGDDPGVVDRSGVLDPSDATWGPDGRVHVVGDLTVPAGVELTVAAGTRILLAGSANLFVDGSLVVQGTPEAPVLFAPIDVEQPWGGIVHRGGEGRYDHTLLTGGGGDPSRVFGHSSSQPVVLVDGGTLTLTRVSIVDNPGKALGARLARLEMTDSLVSRCDTGGELEQTRALIRRTHFVEIPTDDTQPTDDDNDGIYLLGVFESGGSAEPSAIEDCVFAAGQDDGIDHNGAQVVVRRTFVERFFHEGIACSNGGWVRVENTLVRGCEQGIEAGYGDPSVTVDHSVIIDNQVGLRVGDSYDWEVSGSLTVTNSVSVQNTDHNVLNHVNRLGGPLEGALSISYCLVDDPTWDGRDHNVAGRPQFDDTWHLLDGSAGRAGGDDGLDIGLVP